MDNEPRLDARCAADALQRDLSASSGTRISRGLVHKMLAAQKREREQILAELIKIRGLMPLLMKPRNGERWSTVERAELTGQMRAFAHISPYLVIMILPGSFFALPVLAWWLDRRRLQRAETMAGT
jgi:hypothetical protein